MRHAFAWIMGALSVVTACHEDSGAASIDGGRDDGAIDAGLPGPACEQISEEVSRRRLDADAAFLADLVRCAKDDDCATWTPVFRCDDRVQVTDCPAPVASGKLDAAQLWIEQLEQELCPGFAQRCFSSPSCVGGSLHCTSGRCALVRDAGL